MIAALMLSMAVAGTDADWLQLAMDRYRAVDSYRASIRSTHDGTEDRMHYAYRRPGFVRMEFVHPHAGTVLVYSPLTRRVRLWPFGAGHFPVLSLDPDSALIRSPRGQRIDQSDIGTLYGNVGTLLQHGSLAASDTVTLDGQAMRHLDIVGTDGFLVSGVHRYELWLDTEQLFPRKIVSHDLHDAIIETVRMEDVEINVPLPETAFPP